jgi:long-chain acyl-CoA synthetase
VAPDPATLFDRAASTPDDLAIADASGARTWSEVAGSAARSARALRDLLGDDGRLAVVGANRAETALVYAGAVLGGVPAILVNHHLAADEIGYLLRDGGATAVWASPEHVEVAGLAAAAAGLPLLTEDGGGPWRTALDAADPSPTRVDGPAPVDLIYTSGTTGFPKGVEVPRQPPGTIADLLGQMAAHHSAGLGPHLVSGPLYHSGPHGSIGLLLTGTPLVVPARFDPAAVLAAIERHRVASSVMVPTHLVRLLSLPQADRAAADVSSLRRISVTGAACPLPVMRAMIDWFGPILQQAYGASESGPICTITSPEWLERPGSAGRPVARYKVLVLDDADRPVPVGDTGRLFFRDSTGAGIRYRNDPDKTAAAHLEPGVFTLGDVGHVDGEGYVFVTGRSVDMVISGGVNIYPAECERVLREHDQVLDAVVFGVPDPEMGERLVGLASVTGDATAADLVAFCRDRIARYKVPREVHVVADVPRNAMGKIDKAALARRYAEGDVGLGLGTPTDIGTSIDIDREVAR